MKPVTAPTVAPRPMLTEHVHEATPQMPHPPARRKIGLRWVAVAMFVIGCVLRIGLIDRHGLWTDEVFSLAMATGHSLEHPAAAADPSLGDYVEPAEPVTASDYAAYTRHESPPASAARVVRAVRLSDTSPPLYYVLLSYWTQLFGTGDRALRLLSLLGAVAAFPFVWSAGRLAGGRVAAVAAGLLWTLLPLSVYFAVEGRMYGLLWLFASANLWAALRLHRTRSAGVPLAVWVVSGAAGLLTHYFFLFAWLPTCAWLFLYPGRARRGWVVAAAALTGCAVLPWYAQLPVQLASWRLTEGWLKYEPANYHPLGFYLRLPYHFFAISGPWGVRDTFNKLNVLVYVALAVLVWRRLGRAALLSPRWQLAWFILAGTVGGVVMFDLLRGTYAGAVERYVAAGLPAAVLLVARALASLRRPHAVVLTLAISAGCVLAAARMYKNTSRQSQVVRQAAASLAPRVKSSDVIIVHSIPSGIAGFARYLDEKTPRGAAGPAVVSWVGQLKQREVGRDMPRFIAGRRRAFLVRFHDVGEPMPQGEWLKEHARLVGRPRWQGAVMVMEFEPREGETFPATPTPTPSTPTAHGRDAGAADAPPAAGVSTVSS